MLTKLFSQVRRTGFILAMVWALLWTSVGAQQPMLPKVVGTPISGTSGQPQSVVVPQPTLADLVSSRLIEYTRTDLPHGIYFETMNGKSVVEFNSDQYYNPASVTKIMTTLAVLDRFGPQYRYSTKVWYTGSIDPTRHAIVGDLVIEGEGDPSFVNESAFFIGEKLHEAGIYSVEGNLLIGNGMSLNVKKASLAAGNEFLTLLDRSRWTRSTEGAWAFYEQLKTYGSAVKTLPGEYQGVSCTPGKILADDGNQPRKLLLEYRSAPLIRILKLMNAYSNNDMAHMVGRMVGGASGVRDFLIQRVKLAPEEVRLETTSGLGSNMVTPRGVVKVIRYALSWCEKNRVAITDLLPIGGVDNGTLAERFKQPELVGSIVAKTGTLSSVSALAGVLYTRGRGPIIFAIMERGAPHSLRKLQEEIIGIVASDSGGTQAVAFGTEMPPSLIEEAQIRVAKDLTRN